MRLIDSPSGQQATTRANTAAIAPAADPTRVWWRWCAVGVFGPLLVLTAMNRELRVEHWVLSLVVVSLPWWGPRAQQLSVAAAPLVLTLLLYENFALLEPFRGRIRVDEVYNADLALLAVSTPSGPQVLPHFFSANPNLLLDAVCGFAYFAYLFQTVGVALWLYFRDLPRMQLLTWGFLAVNVVGMMVWVAYPAAPPWYVEQYGLGPAYLDAIPSAAGTARFDELLGIHYFSSFYGRNVNVFGAMPSLHVAYPVLVACVTWRLGWRWRLWTTAFAALVAFSAVYLNHHYVVDVIAGTICAATVFALIRWVRHGDSASGLPHGREIGS